MAQASELAPFLWSQLPAIPEKMPKPKRATLGRTPASEESRARRASNKGSARPKEGEQGELAFLSKASSLGFALSLPYGHMQRYDFVVDSGKNIWRVQVKTTEHMLNGLYLVGMHHRANRSAHAYTASEIDFVAVYILPEKTWYILPVREVTSTGTYSFVPKATPAATPTPTTAKPGTYSANPTAWSSDEIEPPCSPTDKSGCPVLLAFFARGRGS